jgi:hypothetical protein
MRLGDAKPQTRGEHARLEDLLDLVKLPNNKCAWQRIQPLLTKAPVVQVAFIQFFQSTGAILNFILILFPEKKVR